MGGKESIEVHIGMCLMQGNTFLTVFFLLSMLHLKHDYVYMQPNEVLFAVCLS